jgi:transcriptional regulator of acetoin/glycerol metabolism
VLHSAAVDGPVAPGSSTPPDPRPRDVNPVIAESWRRSQLSGVSAATAAPIRAYVKTDGQLSRGARPILERREAAIRDAGGCLFLTDGEARVIWVSEADVELSYRMQEANIEPGYSFDETIAGTNSAAVALETKGPVEVIGDQHLFPALGSMRFAGAPIVHPIRRRVIGTLNIGHCVEHPQPLAPLLLAEIVDAIEARLCEGSAADEQLLLSIYLTGLRDCRHPLICLNAQTIVCNSVAARMLGTVDQALLWEQASATINERRTRVTNFDLGDGRSASAQVSPINDDGRTVGAKIELRPQGVAAAVSDQRRPERLPSLVGQGDSWSRMINEALAAKAAGTDPLLLIGEPGTGKQSVARAMFSDSDLNSIDAAMIGLDGPRNWLGGVRTLLDGELDVLLISHLEALEETALRTLGALVANKADGTRVVATMNRPAGAAPSEAVPFAFGSVIQVPPLRDRIDDLPDLLTALGTKLNSDTPVRWMPDAVQTLARLEWPNNLNSLAGVVKDIVRGLSVPVVDARNLPASIRAAASRRPLSHLEQLESAAITGALQQCGGNKLEAAKRLGIARSTLYRRINGLGIDLAAFNY